MVPMGARFIVMQFSIASHQQTSERVDTCGVWLRPSVGSGLRLILVQLNQFWKAIFPLNRAEILENSLLLAEYLVQMHLYITRSEVNCHGEHLYFNLATSQNPKETSYFYKINTETYVQLGINNYSSFHA